MQTFTNYAEAFTAHKSARAVSGTKHEADGKVTYDSKQQKSFKIMIILATMSDQGAFWPEAYPSECGGRHQDHWGHISTNFSNIFEHFPKI